MFDVRRSSFLPPFSQQHHFDRTKDQLDIAPKRPVPPAIARHVRAGVNILKVHLHPFIEPSHAPCENLRSSREIHDNDERSLSATCPQCFATQGRRVALAQARPPAMPARQSPEAKPMADGQSESDGRVGRADLTGVNRGSYASKSKN